MCNYHRSAGVWGGGHGIGKLIINMDRKKHLTVLGIIDHIKEAELTARFQLPLTPRPQKQLRHFHASRSSKPE